MKSSSLPVTQFSISFNEGEDGAWAPTLKARRVRTALPPSFSPVTLPRASWAELKPYNPDFDNEKGVLRENNGQYRHIN